MPRKAIKYGINLKEEEIKELKEFASYGNHNAGLITRARIILLANQGYTDRGISALLNVDYHTSFNV